MINTSVGNLGHLFVIISFVLSLVAGLGYWIATNFQKSGNITDANSWKRFARIAFLVHGLAVFGVVSALFYIIYAHLYEYHYAWNHSSRTLPVYYMISAFWEGQEGSFLLWTFWQVVLGFVLIRTNKTWEAPVMAVFAFVQTFLTSMILGIVINELKLGSNPFILLRDAMPNIPVFMPESPTYNPNFVPKDGTGLNPLLQNYWMVIHPPTLFLGFATTLVPFAYCIAGLWMQRYKEWIRPALPWALFSGAVLGLGILMGGYWAYETLNFGGYWNWDPVENAVYVPWLILIGSIHTMIAFKKNGTALKASMILVITTFILILYSTFLTRSGILGNASVHSFTDLGLSGQLLIYLLFFTILSIVLLIVRWKRIPTTDQEISAYSREFWIFAGAIILCLAGFQVLFTTSIPVFNKIIELLGFVSNIALPADQIEHYTKFQLWAAIFIALLSGTGQFFWWQKMTKKKLLEALTPPLALSLLTSSLLIFVSELQYLPFILLLTASVYSIIANLFILVSVLRQSTFKLAGGSLAHIGIAMMLTGILFSAGYSKIISKNYSGLLLFSPEELPETNTSENEDNVLLWLNKPTPMATYHITYKGIYYTSPDFPSYISKTALIGMQEDPFRTIAMEEIRYKNKPYFQRGDTVKINPENTYYKVEYRDQGGKIFELYPRAQVNPQMGGLLASPDIHRALSKDLYTHVSSVPDPNQEKKWSDTKEHIVAAKDTFFINDYVVVFEEAQRVQSDELVKLSSKDAGVKATLRVLGTDQVYTLEPKFFIKDGLVGRIPATSDELGIKVTLMNIDAQTGKFTFAVNTTQKDYIIMKAVEKPLINVLWIGTLVLMIAFGIATYRRYTEFAKMRDKGRE